MEQIIPWIMEHWEIVAVFILLIDKIVASTPCKQDDLIWTAIKASIKTFKPKKAEPEKKSKKK